MIDHTMKHLTVFCARFVMEPLWYGYSQIGKTHIKFLEVKILKIKKIDYSFSNHELLHP